MLLATESGRDQLGTQMSWAACAVPHAQFLRCRLSSNYASSKTHSAVVNEASGVIDD